MNNDKPYCKNCYHEPHGSTDMDSCHHLNKIINKYPASVDKYSVACGCKSYVKWSNQDSYAEENKLINECESRLAKEFGIENHPKRSKLWSMAWEHGHSSGFSEIENYYRDFVELLV